MSASINFVGMYASKPFWVQDIPSTLNSNADDFHNQMSEVVFKYEETGHRLWVCRDGMLMVQILDLESCLPKNSSIEDTARIWGKYLDHLNSLYLMLDWVLIDLEKSTYLVFSELTNKDAFRLTYADDRINFQVLVSLSQSHVFQLRRYLGHFQDHVFGEPFALTYPVFEQRVFDEVARRFALIVKDETLRKSLAMVAKSVSEFKVGNFETGLLFSWFVIEQLLIGKWEKLINDNNVVFEDKRKRFNSERQKTLVDGKNYPISVLSNILEITGTISFSLFSRIDQIRNCRNKIVHRDTNYVCNLDDCEKAITLASELAVEDTSIRPTHNRSLAVAGF